MPVMHDGHMSHFTGHTVGTVEDLSVVDNAAADTGAQRDRYKTLTSSACAGKVFGHSSTVGVVFNIQRLRQITVEKSSQRYVPKR